MMISKPEWWDYVIWGYDENNEPYMVGFKEGTPKRLLKQYEEYADLMCVDEMELGAYCIYDHEKGCLVGLKDDVPEDFPERLIRHLKAAGDRKSLRYIRKCLKER